MHILVGALILVGVPLAFLAAGAWLGQRLGLERPAQRLATSLLAGLCSVLLALSLVNLVWPLAGAALALVLLPVALSAARPVSLLLTWSDLRATLANRRGLLFVLSAGAFLLALLWPLLTQPAVRFYDGTANHDAFFWIVGADHLQTHTYLTAPSAGAPLATRVAGYISGLRPEWGRMGAESYLALVSSVLGRTPLTVYLWCSAALYSAWLAVVFLIARRFLVRQWRAPAVLALGALQPLFAFYHHNANLPNLLGMICGATLVLALDGGMRAGADPHSARRPWIALAALALHGVLVTYPEIAPFVLLPGGLLALRAGRDSGAAHRALSFGGAALLAGLLLNPLTPWRAGHGLAIAAASAQANQHRADFLVKLAPAEALPALVTLSVKSGGELGPLGGALVSAVLLAVLLHMLRRAPDRIGLVLLFSGGGAVLAYTWATGFHYGWQKAAQFAGVFLAAALPVGAIGLLHAEPLRRAPARAAAVAVAGFFLYALVVVQLDLGKWSDRKVLTADDLGLEGRLTAVDGLARVVVLSETFPYPFFAEMWLAHLLPSRTPHYATRAAEPGGYLAGWVERLPAPSAGDLVVVDRGWADRTLPAVPRLVQTDHFTVLTAEAVEAPLPSRR